MRSHEICWWFCCRYGYSTRRILAPRGLALMEGRSGATSSVRTTHGGSERWNIGLRSLYLNCQDSSQLSQERLCQFAFPRLSPQVFWLTSAAQSVTLQRFVRFEFFGICKKICTFHFCTIGYGERMPPERQVELDFLCAIIPILQYCENSELVNLTEKYKLVGTAWNSWGVRAKIPMSVVYLFGSEISSLWSTGMQRGRVFVSNVHQKSSPLLYFSAAYKCHIFPYTYKYLKWPYYKYQVAV